MVPRLLTDEQKLLRAGVFFDLIAKGQNVLSKIITGDEILLLAVSRNKVCLKGTKVEAY
jgi:hypothetical protein